MGVRMNFISAALIALTTTGLISCGSQSNKDQDLNLTKVDNENLPQAIVVSTDSNGETKYFQIFDSKLANLSKDEFAKIDIEELTSSLTASEVNLVDNSADLGDQFAISRTDLSLEFSISLLATFAPKSRIDISACCNWFNKDITALRNWSSFISSILTLSAINPPISYY